MTRHEIQVLRAAGIPERAVAQQTAVSVRSVENPLPVADHTWGDVQLTAELGERLPAGQDPLTSVERKYFTLVSPAGASPWFFTVSVTTTGRPG